VGHLRCGQGNAFELKPERGHAPGALQSDGHRNPFGSDGELRDPRRYRRRHQTVIEPNKTSTTIEVDVIGDTYPEPDEYFYVDLDYITINGVAVYSGKQAKVTITDEEYY
jgi:hypothetical protein